MNKFIKTFFPRILGSVTKSSDVETELLDIELIENKDTASTETLSTCLASNEYSFQHHGLFYDGLIQLQVIKRTGFNTDVISQFELLETQNCELLIAEWLDNQQFIAVDSTGRIFSSRFNAAEPSKQSLSAIASLGLYPTKDACISNGKLWIVGAPKGGRRSASSLYCVDITAKNLNVSHFELNDTAISNYEMPFKFVNDSMVCVQGTEFVFYQREKRRTHQLVSFNPMTAETQIYPLQGQPAPEEISVRNTFFMDKKRGVALLANTETLSVLESSDENLRFNFELQFIDFKQKKVLWSHKVRVLEAAQICAEYQAEDLIESLTAIAAGDTSSEHHDELQTFIECLTSATISADGNSVWLGWQDGVVQQLSLTGDSILPLHKLMKNNGDGKQRTVQVFTHEPVVIKGQIDDQLILAVGEDEDAVIWQVELFDKQAVKQVKSTGSVVSQPYRITEELHECSTNSVVPTVCQPLALNLVVQASLTEVPTSNGQVDISLQNVNDTAAKIASLTELNALMPKLESHYLKSGQTSLFFSFVAPQVDTCAVLSEYDLFASAAYDEKGAELLASIIRQFASWSCAANILGQKNAPIMADAVLGLADKRQYLSTLAEYFIAIGGQEPIHQFHVNRTMMVIREQHADTPELAAFMAKVPWPWNDASFSVPNVGDYD